MGCRHCDIENYPFIVDDKLPMNAHELIKYAEREYGCQADTNLKITSVASKCLEENGHEVKDRRDLL